MQELKPCPFCGSKDVRIFVYSEGGVCVKCLRCLCQTFISADHTYKDAKEECACERVVKAWNRRAVE